MLLKQYARVTPGYFLPPKFTENEFEKIKRNFLFLVQNNFQKLNFPILHILTEIKNL